MTVKGGGILNRKEGKVNDSPHESFHPSIVSVKSKNHRPWRFSHALHPVAFSLVYTFFTIIYYLAGGTNYYFKS